MQILNKLPKEIFDKPDITTNNRGERYAIIDFIMYRIENDSIELSCLLTVWINTIGKNKLKNRKNIIIKDHKINKMEIINDHILKCDCKEFKKNNDCKHISKLKRLFNM